MNNIFQQQNIRSIWQIRNFAMQMVAAVGLPLCSPLQAFAATSHGHEPAISDLVIPWLNFSAYLVILGIVVLPKIGPAWTARRAKISADIQAANDEVSRAKVELSQVQHLLSTFEEEAAKIRSARQRQTEEQCAKILEQAKAKSEWIRRTAAQLIESEKKMAAENVRNQIVEAALAKAIGSAKGPTANRFANYGQAALDRVDELTIH